MDEIEIISSEENKIKVQSLSIEELQNYKRELKEMIKFLENEIINRSLFFVYFVITSKKLLLL